MISVGTNNFPRRGRPTDPDRDGQHGPDLPPPAPRRTPDFDLLRSAAAVARGCDPARGRCSAAACRTAISSVDSFFDITYRIEFDGAPGGPLAGAGGDEVFSSRWPMYSSAVHPLGTGPRGARCGGSVPLSERGLKVSNLGSSGCDGVSVDFGGAQGGTIVFEPHSLLPGASMRLETVGDAAGMPVSSSLGHVLLARSTGVDSFFDIFYDLSFGGGTETCVQVLNEGSVVSETVVSGTRRGTPSRPASSPVPTRRRCVPAASCPVSAGPSCYFIVFGGGGMISPPDGSDPVQGDEVRMLELEVRVNRIEMARCFFTDDGPWDIQRSSIVMHGRNVTAEDGTLVRCWDGSCRVSPPSCPSATPYRCPDGSCSVSASHCPELGAADAVTVVVSPRDAASGLPTGKRQHKPLVGVHLGSGARVSRPVAPSRGRRHRRGCEPAASAYLTSPTPAASCSPRSSGPISSPPRTRVMIRENPLYEDNGNTGQNPLYEGVAAPGTRRSGSMPPARSCSTSAAARRATTTRSTGPPTCA